MQFFGHSSSSCAMEKYFAGVNLDFYSYFCGNPMWNLQDIHRILIILEMNQEWSLIDREIWVSDANCRFSWKLDRMQVKDF